VSTKKKPARPKAKPQTAPKAKLPKAPATTSPAKRASRSPRKPATTTPKQPAIKARGQATRTTGAAPAVTAEEAAVHLTQLLRFLGDDPTREGLLETPKRVLRSYQEHFSGYSEHPSQHLNKTFQEVEGYDELVLVSDIEVFSHCEHHMVPFVGRAHLAYIPDGCIVGLSKLARVVDVFAKRLQVQEKLTAQIAGAVQEHLQPLGVAVVLQCQHFCMCYRGVRKPGSWTTTSKLHGLFLTDSAARMELLTLIGLRREIGGAGGA
jgi:GTP cyclohydrolase I